MTRRKRVLALALCLLLVLGGGVVVLAINPALAQPRIDAITARAVAGRSTIIDKVALTALYGGMIVAGSIVYPEASRILRTYLYGDADTLRLDPSYFARSAFLRDTLAHLRTGTFGPIRLELRRDPRLAFAVNRFFLEVRKSGTRSDIRLYVEVVFEALGPNLNDRTPFGLGRRVLWVPDALVHVVRTRASGRLFVESRWPEER